MVEIACVDLVSTPSGGLAALESGSEGTSCNAIPQHARSVGDVPLQSSCVMVNPQAAGPFPRSTGPTSPRFPSNTLTMNNP